MTTSKLKYSVSYNKTNAVWVATVKDSDGCYVAAAESESLAQLKKWANSMLKGL